MAGPCDLSPEKLENLSHPAQIGSKPVRSPLKNIGLGYHDF